MQSFKSHLREYTDSPLTLGQISSAHSAGLKELKKFGSKPMAIMGTAGQDYIIGTLSNYDKKEYRGLKKPSGTEIYRYVTPSSAISGQIPIVAVNLDKGHMYFMTPESAEADEPVFEKKIGFRAKYVRQLSGYGTHNEGVDEEVAGNSTASVGVTADDVKNIGPKKRKPSVLTRHYIEVMGKRKKIVK